MSRLHIDKMHSSAAEDYRKLVVNKLYRIMLLSVGCMCFKVGEKAVNTNWELSSGSQQLTRCTLHV